jgi:hypothetical protein
MLTCSADFVSSEGGLAFMTCSVNADSDCLLDTESLFVGLDREIGSFNGGKLEALA